MNFLRRLFSGQSSDADRFVPVYVLSHKCKEPIQGRFDRMSELSLDEGDYAFYARKVLHTSGAKRCFADVEVQVWFDKKKNIAHYEVTGGRWLEAEEYDEELARFNAPAEEDESSADETAADETSADDTLVDDTSVDETEN